tara:strand:+ start:3360 stop:5369 length:2010 start_codon:yes stop_codon:yes gene_type:complete
MDKSAPKYDDLNNRYPGDFRASEIILYSYGGTQFDISGLTSVVNVYQSLDSAFLSGNILFFDTMGIAKSLPIIGNEHLEFKFRNPIEGDGDEELNATNHRFKVYEKRSVKTQQNVQAIALFFTSIESVRNERVRVSKSLEGSYAEMVDKLVKSDKELLNTKKDLFIDPTLGNYKYTFPNVRPLDGVRMMTDLAEPVNFKTPHYMFYENNRGFHFRCLESLFREGADTTRNRPFVAYIDLLSAFNPNFSPPDGEAESPVTKPYSFAFDASYNTLANTRQGMFGSMTYAHDLIDKKFIKSKLSYTNYYEQALHIDAPTGAGNKYQGVMPPGPADFDDDYTVDDKTYGSTNKKQINRLHASKLSKSTNADNRKYMDDYFSRIIVEPSTKWNHRRNSEGLGLDVRATAKQALSSASRDYFSIEIDVPGNFTYNVGDLVWCDVPSFAATEIGNDESRVEKYDFIDQLLTGRYLIQSLHHQIDLLEQKHTTSMTVVRNVFATDLPNADTFKAQAHFRSQPVDVIGSGIDITTLVPLKNKNLKIPSPQISTVDDIAKTLGVDLNTSDLNVKDAANKSINAVLNSTSNRVLANKNLAKINNAILTRKTVVEKIAEKAKLALGGINLSSLTGGGSLNPMAQDRIRSRIQGNVNKFVQASMVSFKQNLASAKSFFKGFF